MIRFKALPTEEPEDTSTAKPAKASKSKDKTAASASKQDRFDLASGAEDEKD